MREALSCEMRDARLIVQLHAIHRENTNDQICVIRVICDKFNDENLPGPNCNVILLMDHWPGTGSYSHQWKDFHFRFFHALC